MNDKIKKLAAMLAGVIAGSPAASLRQDAAYDTAFLARELTQIESEMYRVEYSDLSFRKFIPVKNSGLNPGAKFFVYKVWDYFGLAKWISDYADDLPNVAVRAKEEVSYAASFGDSYQFSAEELMQASMAGIPLEREEANAAFEFCERLMDKTAAFGEPALRMLGFLNHPAVGITTPLNDGTAASTYFSAKTPRQVLRDLYAVSQLMSDRSRKKFRPDTLILPPTIYGLISTTPVSDLQPETTILKVFLATDPYIKSVEDWDLLETAGATAGPRAVFYKKDPKFGQVYIPLEPKAMPPQERNLAAVVNVWGKFGGFVLRQPLSMQYMDGIGPVV